MSPSLRLYSGYLLSSLLAVLLALPVASLLGAALVLGWEWWNLDSGPRLWRELPMLVLLVAFFAVAAGGLVALLFGAPLYALLAWKGWARWWSVALLALLPALVVGWREPQSAGLYLLFGLGTALFTHLFHRHTRLGQLARALAGAPGVAALR